MSDPAAAPYAELAAALREYSAALGSCAAEYGRAADDLEKAGGPLEGVVVRMRDAALVLAEPGAKVAALVLRELQRPKPAEEPASVIIKP